MAKERNRDFWALGPIPGLAQELLSEEQNEWLTGKNSWWYDFTGRKKGDAEQKIKDDAQQISDDAKAATKAYREAVDRIHAEYADDPEALVKRTLGKQADIKRDEMEKQFNQAERNTLLNAQKRGVDNSSVVDSAMTKVKTAEANANEILESKILELAKAQALMKAEQDYGIDQQAINNLKNDYNILNQQVENMGNSGLEDILNLGIDLAPMLAGLPPIPGAGEKITGIGKKAKKPTTQIPTFDPSSWDKGYNWDTI